MTFRVYERADSPYLWVWFRDPETGKRTFHRTDKKRGSPLAWKQAYTEALNKARAHEANKSGAEADWDNWVPDWLGTHNVGERTFDAKVKHWNFLRCFFAFHGIRGPAGVNYALAQSYGAWRKANRRFAGTRPRTVSVAVELRLLKAVMREAVMRGFVGFNPLDAMRIPGGRSAIKPEMSDEDIAKIRAALKEREGHLPLRERWMTIAFEIAIRHGWRLSETSFPLDRIDFKAWTVLVRQKGDRWRTVPVHPELRGLFAQLKADGATMSCVFPQNSAVCASRKWCWFFKGDPKNRYRAPGVAPHLCFHCTRVTVVTRLARQGKPERLVMEWVGHASSVVHAIYRRVSVGDLSSLFSAEANGGEQTQDGGQTTLPPHLA